MSLRRSLSKLPIFRYMREVEKGVQEQQEEIEEQAIITEIHSRRANYYLYEKNGVTPLVMGLLRGDNN